MRDVWAYSGDDAYLFSWEMVTEADYDENAYKDGDDTNNAHSYW